MTLWTNKAATLWACGAFAAFGSLALTGCNLSLSGSNSGCFSDEDCGPEAVCATGYCVGPSSRLLLLNLSVEIQPPQLSKYRVTQFLDVRVEGPSLDFTLPTPTTYDAELVDSENGNVPVAAHMAILGTPRIFGRETDVLLLSSGVRGRLVRFQLHEGSYTVRFSPINEALPAFDFAGFTVRSSNQILKKQFELPLRNCGSAGLLCYRRLSGVVTERQVTANTIRGVEITARSLQQGLMSSTAVSDDTGRYELRLPATAETEFEVVAVLPSSLQPGWAYREILSIREGDRVKDIRIERTDPKRRGIAQIRVVGADGNPVSFAEVTLTATQTPGASSVFFETRGTTNASGHLVPSGGDGTTSVPLLASRYSMLITPSATDPHAQTRTELDLSSLGPDSVMHQQVVTPLKRVLTGRVYTNDGRPLSSANMEFLSVDSDLGERVPVHARPDTDGSYTAFLNPGRYIVVIRPDDDGFGSTFGSGPAGVATLETEEGGPSSDLSRDFRLPGPAQVRGKVIGQQDGAPIDRASLEFFLDFQGETISLGRTSTDERGLFAITLPASVP